MPKFVFGPVLSRRFGLSLGVDLSPEKKQCNFDCLYCELKGAKAIDDMANPPAVKDIMDELIPNIEKFSGVNVITITANGEPTLYPYLKELIDKINEIKNDKKLLLLSNGSLIYEKRIQNSLLNVDIIKLSLDSVLSKTFKKLDRPHSSVDIERIVKGMIEFREMFKNELVLEILVVKNFNDTRDDFIALNNVIDKIRPERVDMGTIDRPSAYKVDCVSYDTLEILSREIKNVPIVITKRDDKTISHSNLSEEEILQLLKLRPQSEQDIEILLDKESQDRFEKLLEDGKIKKISLANICFYKL